MNKLLLSLCLTMFTFGLSACNTKADTYDIHGACIKSEQTPSNIKDPQAFCDCLVEDFQKSERAAEITKDFTAQQKDAFNYMLAVSFTPNATKKDLTKEGLSKDEVKDVIYGSSKVRMDSQMKCLKAAFE